MSTNELTTDPVTTDPINTDHSDDDYYDDYYMHDYNDPHFHDHDLEEDSDEDNNNIYLNDPEYFDYECYNLSKIDWILEKKCENLIQNLGLVDPVDALFLLKKFKWNVQKIIDIYEQDKLSFLQTYNTDKNNNNDVKAREINCNRSLLLSYVNIFSDDSKIFEKIKIDEDMARTEKQPKNFSNKFDTFCEICFTNQLNIDMNMAAAIDECSHYFCRECWRAHFEALINESFWNRFAATSKAFECMQTKCKAIASKEFVLECLKYNINNNEESYSAGNASAVTTPSRVANSSDEMPLWRKALLSNTTRNLPERYKQLVAIDLVEESEDIQLCPGDKIIQEKSKIFNGFSQPQSTGSAAGSPSFSSFLLNNMSTPPQTSSCSSVASSFSFAKLLQSAKMPKNAELRHLRQPVSLSSSFPNTSLLAKFSKQIEAPECAPVITKKCDSIVWIKSKLAARRVTCTDCSSKYCFLCLLPYHAPNSCATIKKWLSKCQDDSETKNYLLVNTQDCPKCRVCIEKNGGCSHMTCNRCKHEFCWVCSNDWKSHGASYDCNRYKGNPEQDTAREALQRYTHYYHRWINHSNSLKFEKAFKEQCQLKIQEKIMNKKEAGTLVDWEFLTEAVEHLTRARYTLQYTYPYAYFLESDNESKKMLFENIQAELERDVENLSHSLEKVTLNDKFNIETQMNIVEKRRKTLLMDFASNVN